MARSALLFALFLLPALAIAIDEPKGLPLILEGKVNCDNCVAHFPTSASTHMAGALVKVECKKRDSSEVTYTNEARTDSEGKYKIEIFEDRGDDDCYVYAAESGRSDCAERSEAQEKALLSLTLNNGMCTSRRTANDVAFTKLEPDSGCETVMAQYELDGQGRY